MNKLTKICIFVFLILLTVVYAEPVPQDQNTQVVGTITQEHKQTRKFFSDEFTRQREQFYKDIDARGDYYEKEADKLMFSAVWKLGLLWGGIMLFIIGINTYLNRRMDKKRFRLLMDAVLKEVNKNYVSTNTEVIEKMKTDEKETKQVFEKELSGFSDRVQDFEIEYR